MMPMLQLSSRNQASKTDDCHIGMAAPSLLSSSSSFFTGSHFGQKCFSSHFASLFRAVGLSLSLFGRRFVSMPERRRSEVSVVHVTSWLFDHCHRARPRRSLSVRQQQHLAGVHFFFLRIDLSLKPGDQFTRDDGSSAR